MTTSFLLSFPCDVWLCQPVGGTLRRSPCRGDALAPPCFAWSARGGPWPFRWAPPRPAPGLEGRAARGPGLAPAVTGLLAVAVCQRAGRRGILICGKGDNVTS